MYDSGSSVTLSGVGLTTVGNRLGSTVLLSLGVLLLLAGLAVLAAASVRPSAED